MEQTNVVATVFTGSLPPILVGIGTVIALALLYSIVSGPAGRNPLGIVIGADGRPSTSKLQFLLWTLVALFSISALFAARIGTHDFSPIETIPNNLLIAVGLSATTMATAKAITGSFVASGRLDKSGSATGFSAIFQDDSGFPDLSKIQVMAWTVLAIVIYLFRVGNQLVTKQFTLPDIDPALMVLTGLGHAAYLGKKLTTTDMTGNPGQNLMASAARATTPANTATSPTVGSTVTPSPAPPPPGGGTHAGG